MAGNKSTQRNEPDRRMNMASQLKNQLALKGGWVLLFVVVATCLNLPVHAQVVTVSVQGRVYDATGAAVPEANVTIVNADTGFSRSSTTTAGGDYQFSALPVGDYTV